LERVRECDLLRSHSLFLRGDDCLSLEFVGKLTQRGIRNAARDWER